jgi:antitoxin CptB
MTKKDSLKKKVLYRSKYRGTKEMDILLSRFVGSCIDNLDEKDLLTLYEFLNYEDEVIYNFYIGNNVSNYESKNKFFKIFKNFKI